MNSIDIWSLDEIKEGSNVKYKDPFDGLYSSSLVYDLWKEDNGKILVLELVNENVLRIEIIGRTK